jgi:hypothetical protein
VPTDTCHSPSTCHGVINAFAARVIAPTSSSDLVIAACLSVGPIRRSNPMSTETASTLRTRRRTAFAVVALLSLSAVTSANASPGSLQNFHASSPARSYYLPSFRAPPQARSWYSPSTSMIAPPMQEASPVAPLAPHI